MIDESSSGLHWVALSNKVAAGQRKPTGARLGPKLDGKRDGLHGIGVAPDEEATEQNPRQPIPLSIQVCQVTNVI